MPDAKKPNNPLPDTAEKVLIALGESRREAEKRAKKLKDPKKVVGLYAACMKLHGELRKPLKEGTDPKVVSDAWEMYREARGKLLEAVAETHDEKPVEVAVPKPEPEKGA